MTTQCDNASVGVLVVNDAGAYLMLTRATPPAGVAPVAGHVFDAHPGYTEAAVAEVAEEVGLTVETLETLPVGGWRANRCRRGAGPRGVGHQWQLYGATVRGRLAPSSRETRGARWLTPRELQRLADRTAAHAHGQIGAEEFVAQPGLEPVWVAFLAELGLVHVRGEDLAAIERLAEGA